MVTAGYKKIALLGILSLIMLTSCVNKDNDQGTSSNVDETSESTSYGLINGGIYDF